MQTISIQTSQNIELEYELAGIGDRLVAYIIDMLIYGAYFFTVILLYQATYSWGNETIRILIIFLPILFYQLLCEIFLNGQSLGKKVRNIKVISLDGKQPSVGQYLIRWLFRIVDTMISSGVVAIVTIALSSKAQRVGDMLAGTTVVRTRRSTQLRDTIYMETTEQYTPRYQVAGKLSDDDIALLKEVVNRYKNDPSNNAVILQKASDKIRTILMEDHVSDPLNFLETVIRDYNALSGKENG